MSNHTVGPYMGFSDGLIPPNTRLPNDGSWVISPNQEHVLISQPDGNVVLYQVIGQPPKADGDTFAGEATWATGTNNKGSAFFIVQNDGNLVIYDSNSKAIWSSGTSGQKTIYLAVQDDGNLVLYKQTPLWSSGTNT
ncbi:MAG: hypothetical protein ACI8RZ_000885 [Myxococcota bacterium]|jgi:hypothetical protein